MYTFLNNDQKSMLYFQLFSMLVVYKYIMVLSGKVPSITRQTQVR